MQAIVEGRVQSIGNKIRLISDELSTVSKNLEDRISSFEGTLNVVRNYFDTVYERANILHQQQQQQQQQQGYNEQEDGSVDISMGYSPVQESFSRAPQPMPVMRDPYQKLHDHLAQR